MAARPSIAIGKKKVVGGVIVFALALALPLRAGDKRYEIGTLMKVEISGFAYSSTQRYEIYRHDVPVGLAHEPNRPPIPVAPAPVVTHQQYPTYVVTVENLGTTYVAACTLWNPDNYYSSEWILHGPVPFRVDKNKLFLKRPNGKELRLGIVKQLRAGLEVPRQGSGKLSVPDCR